MATRIKVGDTVQIMSGRRNRNPEKPPTRGKVMRVDRENGLVWVEGVNRRIRHLKKAPQHPQGGRVEREAPVSVSNVMLVTTDGVPVRLAKAVRGDDDKITARDAKAAGEKPAKPAKAAKAKK